ncbi:OmpA family protein [Dokdonella sp.]|uniref:OmpA family protein n=1 Tax=Dokdonella sp. TaxID=2291710 RepID=UPI001AFEEB32|nr:OmpA family protein [Dokdonella sp.]MBO9662497.1 OmpA family protein [Dokdonella sp.]
MRIVLLAAALFGASAQAQLIVERVPTRLGERASTWSESPQPQSLWQEKGIASTTATGGPASSLAPAAVPKSEFALADVPPERLDATRKMLGELQARPDAQGAIVVDLPGDVLFDFDKSDLRADALPVLDRIVGLLAAFPARGVAVNGHTDSKGDDAYNDGLSRRRAETVHRYLHERDGSPARAFDVRGFGEKQPVASNTHADGSDDPQGRQKNRRVEIVLRPVQS